MTPLQTIPEIKQAVDAGNVVRCDGGGYEVIKDSIGQYLIHHIGSDYYIGLHGRAGTKYAEKLNGRGFFIPNGGNTMKATRTNPASWADNGYTLTMNGHDRQMLLGALQRQIRHHEHKAATLKTPGNVKRHRRTAEAVAEIYNELYTCN